jgi:hypothetical protein
MAWRELVFPALFLAAWLLIQLVILPRFGVST